MQENIALKDFTTIKLGGTAKYFCVCSSVDELKEAMRFAEGKKIRAHLLGGGSNTIFSDEGFKGLVVKIDLKGISETDDGNDAIVAVKAGEDWEPFVRMSVEKGYAGLECLSGIPGLVGATPIQNVGAYGQEVKDTIVSVKVLERGSLQETGFQNSDCNFSYRSSRFKTDDAGKYIVTEVSFRLRKNGRPTVRYPEVKKTLETTVDLSSIPDGRGSLEAVRNVVLSLRKKKINGDRSGRPEFTIGRLVLFEPRRRHGSIFIHLRSLENDR